MRRAGQGEVDIAAAVVVMIIGGVLAIIGGVERRVASRRFTGLDLIGVMIVVVGHVRHGLIGHAGELCAVLDAVLVVEHPMHLHRDHDGHAEIDAKEADQSRQVENSQIKFR